MSLASLQTKLGDKILAQKDLKGIVSLKIAKEELLNSLKLAKSEGFEMLSDVFGIDYLTYPAHQGKRFQVCYNLYHIANSERVILRLDVADEESLPTITSLWKGANFMEREVYDMFGIVFEDHPDLRKIITPEDLDGYPLRKDFPIGETPTLFNEGRFLDPASFRAGLSGQSQGLTGWRGGARKGVDSGNP